MKRVSLICFLHLLILLLSGCQLSPSDFSVPTQITLQGEKYIQVSANQIDQMKHILYLPEKSKKDVEHWQQGILLFLDQNIHPQPLVQRRALRKAYYAKNPTIEATLTLKQDTLYSEVLYPPTDREQNYLLEVSKGKNLMCGFAQIQFSQKRDSVANISQYRTALTRLSDALNQLPWIIGCR